MSDRGLKSSLEILFGIPEFDNFYTTYSTKKQLKSKSDFYLLLDEFKGFLQQQRIITDVEALLFKKNIDKYYEELKKVKAVRLDSEYLTLLEEFVNSTLRKTTQIDDDFNEHKESLLKEANLVHKEKNKSNYKKEKHKSKDFYDGY